MMKPKQYEIRADEHGIGNVFWLKGSWLSQYKQILAMENIEAIRISGLAPINELDLDFLVQLPFLRSVEIYDWDVTDVSMIEALPKIEVLGLQIKRTKVLDFNKFPALRVAKLRWCKGLESVFECESLEYLNAMNYPHDSLEPLHKLVGLKRLYLTSRKLKTLKRIDQLTNLEELDLYDCRYLETDTGLDMLQNLKKIEIEACNKLKNKQNQRVDLTR